MRVFGTFEWWKEYIWGVNKIQNYIYIISFAIALIMLIYYTIGFFNNQLSNGTDIIWIGYTLIVAILFSIILVGLRLEKNLGLSIIGNSMIGKILLGVSLYTIAGIIISLNMYYTF